MHSAAGKRKRCTEATSLLTELRNFNEIPAVREPAGPDEMATYLGASIEGANGDAAFIAKALGDIARAQGMTEIARKTCLSR